MPQHFHRLRVSCCVYRNARLSHWETFALQLIWAIDWQRLSHKPLLRSLLPVFPRPLTAASLTIWPSSGIHVLMLPVSFGEACVCAAARCPERQWRHAVAMWKNAIWLGADGWLGGLSASSERVPEGSPCIQNQWKLKRKERWRVRPRVPALFVAATGGQELKYNSPL